MNRGDRVLVTRYGTRGRPPRSMTPEMLPGTVVKRNGSCALVRLDGRDGAVWVAAKNLAPVGHDPHEDAA